MCINGKRQGRNKGNGIREQTDRRTYGVWFSDKQMMTGSWMFFLGWMKLSTQIEGLTLRLASVTGQQISCLHIILCVVWFVTSCFWSCSCYMIRLVLSTLLLSSHSSCKPIPQQGQVLLLWPVCRRCSHTLTEIGKMLVQRRVLLLLAFNWELLSSVFRWVLWLLEADNFYDDDDIFKFLWSLTVKASSYCTLVGTQGSVRAMLRHQKCGAVGYVDT